MDCRTTASWTGLGRGHYGHWIPGTRALHSEKLPCSRSLFRPVFHISTKTTNMNSLPRVDLTVRQLVKAVLPSPPLLGSCHAPPLIRLIPGFRKWMFHVVTVCIKRQNGSQISVKRLQFLLFAPQPTSYVVCLLLVQSIATSFASVLGCGDPQELWSRVFLISDRRKRDHISDTPKQE